jgi:acyl-CoA thioesterase-1
MLFRIVLSLLFLLTANLTFAAPTLLVLGDSLSAGYGIGKEQSWPALLAQRLKAEGYPHTVVNLSISGETTQGGASRLPAAITQHRPAILILALGANDGLRGLPIAQMRHNLATMLRLSQTAQTRVLLVGMRLPPNYGPVYEQAFAASYTELAKEHKVALHPFLLEGLAENRSAFLADGLHPTAASQPLILKNLWPRLKPLLNKPR